MALPGTPGQRISDLCNGNKIKQKELAEKIGVSASQLSRIVSGETRTVSSDILIGVAKAVSYTHLPAAGWFGAGSWPASRCRRWKRRPEV